MNAPASWLTSSTAISLLFLPLGLAAQSPMVSGNVIKTVTDINGGSLLRGDTIEYNVTITNSGSGDALRLRLLDTLPAVLTYVPGSIEITSGPGAGPGTDARGDDAAEFLSGRRVRVRLGTGANGTTRGTLGAGVTTSVRFRARVNLNASPSAVVRNRAAVEYTDPVTGRAVLVYSAPPGGTPGTTTDIAVRPTDIDIEKTHTGAFVRGQQATWTLQVRNAGPGVSTGATVSDVIPAGFTPLSAGGVGWSCSIAGQSLTCTTPSVGGATTAPPIVLTVQVLASAPSSATNTATVTAGLDSDTDSDVVTVTGTVAASNHDVAIVKTAATALVPGSNITWNLAVSNVGTATTTAATTVTDLLPAGLTFSSAGGPGWVCSAVGQLVTCIHAGTLAAGASTTITLAAAASAAVTGSISNTATVATPGDSNPLNDSSTATSSAASGVDLDITKSAGSLVVGSPGIFTLDVRNVGPATTTGPITVTDMLPAGLAFGGASGAGFTCTAAGQLVTCLRTIPLSPGQSAAISVTVTPTAAALPSVVNTAVVGTPGDGVAANDTSTIGPVPVTLLPPDLLLRKSLPGPVRAGQNVVFFLDVTNVGGSATTGPITITDVLEPGLSFVSAGGQGWSCSASGQVVTCINRGQLAPGSTMQLTLVVNVAPTVSIIRNSAVVTTPGDPDGTNNTGAIPPTAPAAAPDLALAKSAIGTFTVGGHGSYALTVTNIGSGPTTGPITLVDVLPASLVFVSASGAGWSCNALGQTVTCINAGPLAPGASSSVTLVVTPLASAAPSVVNSAAVSTPGDVNPSNDGSGVTTPVGGVIDLGITKSGLDTLPLGGQADYVLTVRNVGTLPTAGPITVTDTLPAGLSLASASGDGFSCAGTIGVVTCTRTLPPFSPGEQAVIVIRVNVAADLRSPVRNVACVATPGDATVSNDCSLQASAVSGFVDVVGFKDVEGQLEAGRPAVFRLAMRNFGAAFAQAPLTMVDTLPAGLAFVSGGGSGWTCSAAGRVVTCQRNASLAPGETAGTTITVDVGSAAVPMITNCMVAGAANETGTRANNRSCIEPVVKGTGRLEVIKSAARAQVATGETVEYTIVVRNTGSGDLTDVRVSDSPPAGFVLVAGTVRIGALASAAPVAGPTLVFPVGRVSAGSSLTVRYHLRVGPGARPGPAINTAVAESPSRGLTSDAARARVIVERGAFSTRGSIAGKVLIKYDCQRDPSQNAGDVGIPGVRIHLEDGTSAITDVEGKFSFTDVESRLHLVRVDRTTLPPHAVMVPLSNRQAFDGWSRFVDVKGGELHRADFAEGSHDRTVLDSVLARRQRGEVDAAGVAGVPDQVTGTVFFPTADSIVASQRLLPLLPGRHHPEPPGQLVTVGIAASVLPADGKTATTITIGTGGDSTASVSVESSLGRLVGPDRDPVERGLQIDLARGETTLTLIASGTPGRAVVRVTSGAGVVAREVEFVAPPRELMLMGLINARVDFRELVRGGLGVSGGDAAFEQPLRDLTFGDSAGTRGGARAALLARGTVLDNRQLTVAWDTERDAGRTLLRDIRPDEGFPIFGDAGIREFDARSRRGLYARLEKGAGYTLVGDFQTGTSDARQLSAFSRTLTGAVQHTEGERGSITLFASEGRLRQEVVELSGKGISGPYQFADAAVINSERVEVLVRDRAQPSIVVSRRVMTRFADYTVDPWTGRLLFREPIPALDAALNPVSIRVTFETEQEGGEAFMVYGGNAAWRPHRSLEVGAAWARDESGQGPATVAGLNAAVQLGAGTTVIAEVARGQTAASGGDDKALRGELRHQSGAAQARAWVARTGEYFNNPSSTFAAGRRDIGGSLSVSVTGATRLIAEGLDTRISSTGDRRIGLMTGVERRFSPSIAGELGFRYGESSSGDSLDALRALRAMLRWSRPRDTRTALFGEVEHDVTDGELHRAAVGGDWMIGSRARLYGRHEWARSGGDQWLPGDGPARAQTVFGMDADYLRNTRMFSEYRARDAFAGRDAEAAIGLNNSWQVGEGLAINTSFSRISPLGPAPAGDVLSVTGAVEWVRPSLHKTTARAELRDAPEGPQYLASLGHARKLSRDWTLIARTLWDDEQGPGRTVRGFTQAGLAWRQTDLNRWNGLLRYEHRLERNGFTVTDTATRAEAHLISGLLNYQPVQRFTLSGRYTGRRAHASVAGVGSWSTTQLVMGRALVDLNRHFDAGVIASSLFSNGLGDRSYGLGGELGLIAMKNLRIAVGYNIFGYANADLYTFGATRRGAYLELGLKFDESFFGIAATPPAGGTRE